jgi:dTMP kinase
MEIKSKGKLIIIEGLDGSGKTTQTELLAQRLRERGNPVRRLKFPDYDSKSSALVKMYLAGEIGGIDEVNLYAASSFYACDRYISFTTGWKADYEAGAAILCDRYTTSNIIYQMAKLPKPAWNSYIDWLWDYEFTRLGLPEPDLVLYLDMEPETSRALLHKRYGGDAAKLDIHEANLGYLFSCREAAHYAAQKLHWHILRCCDGGKPLLVEEVAARIAAVADELA